MCRCRCRAQVRVADARDRESRPIALDEVIAEKKDRGGALGRRGLFLFLF